MRLVGLRSILPLLPPLALACAAPNPSAPEQAKDAIAPSTALEQAAAGPAPSEPSQPSESIHAEPELESASAPAPARRAPADAGPPGAPSPGAEADRSQSRLDIAVPSINGGLNRDIIRRIASDHADDIRDCHGRALASLPNLAGKLVVHVELDANGEVREAKLGDDSSLHNRDVESCVLTLIEGWSFADAGGNGRAELVFAF